MTERKRLTTPSSRQEIDAFLKKVAATPAPGGSGRRGRLIFALDATASREPTWDMACSIQGEMFRATGDLGGLEIQLAYYRGFGEFHTSPWTADTDRLLRQMTGVRCLGGQTQIGRLFRHTLEEARRRQVDALVFVGDCMEEDVDKLARLAGELGLMRVPVFLFHEGDDIIAARAFRQFATLSNGACCPFDTGSAGQLRELLRAVAVYAAGGQRALERLSRGERGAMRLLQQLKGR
jgi:hypothetical protein